VAARKIHSLSEFLPVREELRLRGLKLVFTNGCFDLLHAGHIGLFREARRLGDALIVALNDDASVRRLKGPSRPVTPLEERLEILEAVETVSYLTWFAEDTPREIIAVLRPDVLVKGGDWKPDEVVGREEVESAGGRVVIVPYLPGHSTSSILDRIRSKKKAHFPPRRGRGSELS